MIAGINTKIENYITPEFIQIFNGQKYLVVNKTSELFKCFLKLIFNNIKEDEIFTFKVHDKFSFINETTNLFLKNKKLLKNDIIEFSHNNELFLMK